MIQLNPTVWPNKRSVFIINCFLGHVYSNLTYNTHSYPYPSSTKDKCLLSAPFFSERDLVRKEIRKGPMALFSINYIRPMMQAERTSARLSQLTHV